MKGQRFALHCVGFKHFGEWEGLLAAAASGKSGCSSCFADASEQGVSPRIEVGGLTWFALALRSPGCSCFCLRLDFQVTVSVRGGSRESTLGAFSTRTLKSSGVPAKRVQAGGFCVGMLTLACSTPACPGLVVVRFRGVHRSGFLGSCSPLKISLWLSCLHCVGLQQFGEREGLFEQRALGCFRFHASLVVLRVLPGVGAGSEARGEGLRCSQAAVVLADEVQVTVSVLVCLATLLSQYRRCCCLS